MIIFSETRFSHAETLHKTTESHLFRCYDKDRGHMVLIRVFFTSDDAEKSYILTEAAAFLKIQHPGLATVYDVGTTTDEYPFVAFEDVQGTSLAQQFSHSTMSVEQLTTVISTIFTALATVHAHYRTLLCLDSTAIFMSDNGTKPILSLNLWNPGSPGYYNSIYHAPESRSGRTNDARADLYSVGVILFEMITHQTPQTVITTDSPGMTAHLLVQTISETYPSLPGAFAQWITGLLEHDRSMRFFSVYEALEYLTARKLLPDLILHELTPTPCCLIPVYPVGMETIVGAINTPPFENTDFPVFEISGEPGLGKTMVLEYLFHQALDAETRYVSGSQDQHIPEVLSIFLGNLTAGRRAVFIIDNSEFLSESIREQIRQILAERSWLHETFCLLLSHRSQLNILSHKARSLTLSNFTQQQLSLFCEEMLGRCTFTGDWYKDLYTLTKGHPLFIEELLRYAVRKGLMRRQNRIWTFITDSSQPVTPFPQSLISLIITNMRDMDEATQEVLIVLSVLETPSAFGVSLHILAEILDASTQAVMRILLPLVFAGYVRIYRSYIMLAHDTYKEAIYAGMNEEAIERIRIMVDRYWAAIGEQQLSSHEQLPELGQQLSAIEQSDITPATGASAQGAPTTSPLLRTGLFSGFSTALQSLQRTVYLAAQYDIPVLLEGESGSGKEEIALTLHLLSSRSALPFQAINCSDFSGYELDTYLFGSASEEGLLHKTQGGTMYLDEITTAPLPVQTKLSRIAQQTIKRQSADQHNSSRSTQPRFDVRLIIGIEPALPNAEEAVQRGLLLPDLFFSISSLRLNAPALRDRKDDLPLLIEYFRKRISEELACQDTIGEIPPEVFHRLLERHWHGNILELESLIRRMLLIGDVSVLYSIAEQIPPSVSMQEPESSDSPLPTTNNSKTLVSIDDAQKQHILRALELTGGNKTKAADMLQIKRTTLIARMKKFGMMP